MPKALQYTLGLAIEQPLGASCPKSRARLVQKPGRQGEGGIGKLQGFSVVGGVPSSPPCRSGLLLPSPSLYSLHTCTAEADCL